MSFVDDHRQAGIQTGWILRPGKACDEGGVRRDDDPTVEFIAGRGEPPK
jgi:hypothetical protein